MEKCFVDSVCPPLRIQQAAVEIGHWFADNNIKHWELANCASRDSFEQLRQRVAELEKERDELIEVKAAENASWNAGFNVQADQIKKLTAEVKAANSECELFRKNGRIVDANKIVELRTQLAAAQEEIERYKALAKINEVLHD